MPIVNQPIQSTLGEEILKALNLSGDDQFDNFQVIVAYVRKSGVSYLKKSCEAFKSRGGKINCVVGIDQKNSSIEGISELLSICTNLYIYHNELLTQTFHPKIYIFEKENTKSTVFIGSSNLTGGGLFTNYEVNFKSEFNLSNKEDREAFKGIKDIFAAKNELAAYLVISADRSSIK